MVWAVSWSKRGFFWLEAATAAVAPPHTFLAVCPTKLAKDAVDAAKDDGMFVAPDDDAVVDVVSEAMVCLGSGDACNARVVSCAKSWLVVDDAEDGASNKMG